MQNADYKLNHFIKTDALRLKYSNNLLSESLNGDTIFYFIIYYFSKASFTL